MRSCLAMSATGGNLKVFGCHRKEGDMDGPSDRYIDRTNLETAMSLQTIEEQIAQLWSAEARRDDPISSLATHAAVLNLIIYAPDSDTAHELQRSAEEVSQIHPCRAILFDHVSGTDSSRLTPEIYATCEADGSDPATPCIERIRIPVTDPLYPKLSALSQPLIIPELPAVLWWHGPVSPTDRSFLSLARSTDVTIIDSQRFQSPGELRNLVELDAAMSARSAIADLNWHRLKPWRELTAQFFDIKAANWSLSWIREIEIDVGQQPGNTLAIQALLFVAWIAHCLEWAAVDIRRTRQDRWYIGMQDHRESDVRIIIRTRPTGNSWSGHLLGMTMTAKHQDGNTCSLSLNRSRGSSVIRMNARTELETTLHHAVHHPRLSDQALLMPILESPGRDQMYEASLEKANDMFEALNSPEVK
jgi:glucose-6-phosphate dehydrogenase assembly protein OpcA